MQLEVEKWKGQGKIMYIVLKHTLWRQIQLNSCISNLILYEMFEMGTGEQILFSFMRYKVLLGKLNY